MTTLTPIPSGAQAKIAVHADRTLSKINPNIYGGFIEHMGRCIYSGVYDPGSPLSNDKGYRKDVIAALKDIQVPVIRYPGGNFCATYHWEDGIGPRAQRPRRPELAWLGEESNAFGTDEFLDWCAEVGTQPYLCLNFGTGTLDEALHWLEYCNSSADTYYANLRRRNGRDAPYNVKYWALGNECWGPWQVEQMTKEDYAKKAKQWAKALRLLDPSITLILCGETGYSAWDAHVLHECVDAVAMHSIHIYTYSGTHLCNASAPLSAERAIEITGGLIDLAYIEKGLHSRPPPKICVDEWNVWDPVQAPGENGAEQIYTLSDALAVAVWLGVFVRQAKHMGMANIAQSVNVLSPLRTTAAGLIRQASWWPLYLFSKYMRGTLLAAHVASPVYEGPTAPAWLGALKEIPLLDVAAVLDRENRVVLAVANISETDNLACALEGIGAAQTFTVTGPSAAAVNIEGEESVTLVEGKWDGGGVYTFPRLSLTVLRAL